MTTTTAPAPIEAPPKPKASDPVGYHEIAVMLDVKRQTCHQWQWRGQMPPADWTIHNLPAWRRDVIIRWAVATGRITREQAKALREGALTVEA